MVERVLIVGYGNTDRQDDGVAWHVLSYLSARLDHSIKTSAQDVIDDPGRVDLLYQMQLTPELVELFAGYEKIIFVDARVDDDSNRQHPDINQDVRITALDSRYQASPLTHHLTPQSCMALLDVLYSRSATGILVSIKGYEFGFNSNLSTITQRSALQAAQSILEYLPISELND